MHNIKGQLREILDDCFIQLLLLRYKNLHWTVQV